MKTITTKEIRELFDAMFKRAELLADPDATKLMETISIQLDQYMDYADDDVHDLSDVIECALYDAHELDWNQPEHK